MSKIKDWLIYEQQKEYEMYIGYEYWLFENNIQVLKENDINEMEEELKNPSTLSNFIISNIPFNNANYNNSLVGA